MRRQRAVMFLLVATLLGGACGDGGDEGTDAGGTTVAPPSDTTSSTVPPTTATDPALAARAQAAVFQQADFPAGWRPVPEDDPGLGIDTVWRELTRCLGVEAAAQARAAATSPTFRLGRATQAQATVAYTDESSAAAISTALAGPKSEGCLQEVFAEDVKRNAPEGSVPGPVAVAPLDFPPAGTKTFAVRITFTIDVEGLTVSLFEDFLVVFDGEAVIRMAFLNPGSEFPPNLQRSLVEKVVTRA